MDAKIKKILETSKMTSETQLMTQTGIDETDWIVINIKITQRRWHTGTVILLK